MLITIPRSPIRRNGANAQLDSGQLLTPFGSASAPSFSFTGRAGDGMFSRGASQLGFAVGSAIAARVDNNRLVGTTALALGPNADVGSEDVLLVREAAQILALRNGANPQDLRVYGTFTDAANYERLSAAYSTGNAQFELRTANAGSGAARSLLLYAAARLFLQGATGVQVEATGGSVGFYGTTPATKQSVTGSRGGNAALASLLTALATIGLITDSSTA